VAVKVEDVAPNGYTMDRAAVRQKKTGRPVKFELTDQTRQAIDDYLKATGKKPGEFLFTGQHRFSHCMTTRQYARLLSEWIASIGLDPKLFGTHSLRRTKATLISANRKSMSRSAFARAHQNRKHRPIPRH
jgi:integrase